MGTLELRNIIFNRLNATDDTSMLKDVLQYIEEYKKNKVVAYSVDGEPLTKEQYINKVEEADASIDEGNYTTLDDLEREAENW